MSGAYDEKRLAGDLGEVVAILRVAEEKLKLVNSLESAAARDKGLAVLRELIGLLSSRQIRAG